MHLKPDEFYNLTVLEFEEMLKGYQMVEDRKRAERAYWVSWIIRADFKKPIGVAELLKPFEKKKNAEEINEENEEFFHNFYKQREEAINGNHSRVNGAHRGR